MGLFTKTKGSIISDYFQLKESVANLTAGNMVNVELYDDHLDIKEVKNSVSLRYDQIIDIFYGLQTEIVSQGKSVIGRAVAGGLIFGGVGAVVGAVSGTGTKDKKERHFYFIISYTSSTGEDKFIQFEDTRLYKGAKVANKLKQLCNITPAPDHVDL